MKRIASFEKVSMEQFRSAWEDAFRDVPFSKEIYDGIKLPLRATSGSAGYDFYSPLKITVAAGETVRIPTGIRAKMEDGWVLQLYPRSGLGYKFRFQLDNTVGIIDSDYYYAENEGHIMAKLTNCSTEGKSLVIEAGGGFMQGIFTEFGITMDDCASGVRTGGFGSTGK